MKSKGGRIAISVLAGLLPVVFGVGLLIAPGVVGVMVAVVAVAAPQRVINFVRKYGGERR